MYNWIIDSMISYYIKLDVCVSYSESICHPPSTIFCLSVTNKGTNTYYVMCRYGWGGQCKYYVDNMWWTIGSHPILWISWKIQLSEKHYLHAFCAAFKAFGLMNFDNILTKLSSLKYILWLGSRMLVFLLIIRSLRVKVKVDRF